MGWNQPPGRNDDKNPWGGKGNGSPPDLDEIIKKMQKGLGGIFGGRSGKTGNNKSIFPWLLALVLLAVWLVYDMAHIIDQQERGAVLRFGRHVATLQPGLSIRFPKPIEEVIVVNVGRVQRMSHRAKMLTQDENIVDVEVAVKWKVKNDPADFLFNVKMPEDTLRQVIESVVREVIGKNKLDFILTEGRAEIAQNQRELMTEVLDDLYKIGIVIESVEMQSAKPPEEVKAAFDDAIKAREDEQRYVNQAQAYQNEVIPIARGNAARLIEEATAYKARTVARAEGEANRFDQLLTEYQRAPLVTRERLYLDAIENVFRNTNKVFIDDNGGNSLMYLPIDQLMKNRREERASNSADGMSPNQGNPPSETMQDRINQRNRGER